MRTYPKIIFCFAAWLLAISLGSASAQRGALTVHRNIAELTQQAATIVHGQIISTRVESHPELTNLTTLVVTMRVSEKLKGNADSTLVFRQYIWDVRDKYDAAGYHKGQEMLVLLNPVSSYGLTSPTGMEQGRFLITRDERGTPVTANGYSNAGLFSDLEAQASSKKIQLSPSTSMLVRQHIRGPVPLSQLETLIRQFAGTSK